jgi:hypothetical protein
MPTAARRPDLQGSKGPCRDQLYCVLLHVDFAQLPAPEEMLRGKVSVPVPGLKDVQGSEKLPDVVKTQDRVVRGVTGPPFVLCCVAHLGIHVRRDSL